MGGILGKSSAERQAERAAKEQEKLMKEQRQREQLRLAENESEVARRRALAQKSGGRSLLVKTSPTGVQSLGGQ